MHSKRFKHTLMIRMVVGHYSSATDTDKWNVSTALFYEVAPEIHSCAGENDKDDVNWSKFGLCN